MLLSFFVVFALFTGGFVVTAYEAYGPEMGDFSEIVKSFKTTIFMAQGQFSYDGMSAANMAFTPIVRCLPTAARAECRRSTFSSSSSSSCSCSATSSWRF